MATIASAPATHGRPRPRSDARRTAAWNAGAIVVVWLTSLFVVALWVSGGGVDAVLAGGGEALTAAGRLFGLIAANLMLYQVLLMARIPLFERGFGNDALTRAHRLVGFWSFWLMLAHIVLIVAGYAVVAQLNPFLQLWEFVWDYPGVLLATAGTLLLIGVTVTSLRRARRRLRYESWHLLHLYAYIGVGIALPHQLWAGADFTATPWAAAYWWTLWALAAAAVAVFRLAVPLARSWRHDLRVTAVEADGTDGVTVRVRGSRSTAPAARGGQFFVWRFLDGPGWTRGHPFSLSGAPRGGELRLSARVVGDGSVRLAALRPGTRVLVEGPYGRLTGGERRGSKLLLLGAGAGVAPLVSLLESEPYAAGEATLVTRDSAPEAALRRDAVRQLVSARGVRHVPLHGPRASAGASWLPQSHAAWSGPEAIRFLAPDLDEYDVFVCGPPAWMDAVVRDLRAAGAPAARIHTESFDL
jgi:predicted ferric reductase